jgi:hypothetical protein
VAARAQLPQAREGAGRGPALRADRVRQPGRLPPARLPAALGLVGGSAVPRCGRHGAAGRAAQRRLPLRAEHDVRDRPAALARLRPPAPVRRRPQDGRGPRRGADRRGGRAPAPDLAAADRRLAAPALPEDAVHRDDAQPAGAPGGRGRVGHATAARGNEGVARDAGRGGARARRLRRCDRRVRDRRVRAGRHAVGELQAADGAPGRAQRQAAPDAAVRRGARGAPPPAGDAADRRRLGLSTRAT